MSLLSNNEPANDSSFDSNLPVLRFKAKVNNEGSFLSNFYPHVKNFSADTPQPENNSILFRENGIEFHSTEQYYQYQKYLVIDPEYAKNVIMPTSTAESAKKVAGKGEYILRTKSLRPKSTKVAIKKHFEAGLTKFVSSKSLETMRKGLRLKYLSNRALRDSLVRTYPRKLSELGRMKKDYWAHTGKDMLGKLLMELRDELRKETLKT